MTDTDLTQLAFIDTETLGLDPDRNPVWEIAVIVDDVEHCWLQRLPVYLHDASPDPVPDDFWSPPGGDPRMGLPIGPESARNRRHLGPYVSQWVLDNTGINDRYDHSRALTPKESTERFTSLVAGRHLVGAVPSFDEQRLARQHRAHVDADGGAPLPWHYHLIDVETLAVGALATGHRLMWDAIDRPTIPALPFHSDEISRALGVEPPSDAQRHSALGDARWARDLYLAVMGS